MELTANTDFRARTEAQKRQAWLFLVEHNYTRLFGRDLLEDLGKEKAQTLLSQYYRDRVGHTDTARALFATEVDTKELT